MSHQSLVISELQLEAEELKRKVRRLEGDIRRRNMEEVIPEYCG